VKRLSAVVMLISVASAMTGFIAAASSQQIFSAYTSFDADRNCRHTPGRDPEDYGSWTCRGYAGLIVRLSAGDQRMQVSFGHNARAAAKDAAASQSFPGFNSVYQGRVEWRIERLPNGKTRPVATILRWNTRTAKDAEREDGKSTGRTLVVTRLNPGGVCHVGYVDARGPSANEVARRLADEKARSLRCGVDEPSRE
jgi:hypothetical protein